MKKLFMHLSLVVLTIFLLAGCSGSKNQGAQKIKLSKQFRLNDITFNLQQTRVSKIVYHTEEEMKKLLSDKITELLKEKNLLSDDESMNVVKIHADYMRTYVGDGSPASTDSLRYPEFGYKIEVSNDSSILRNVEKNGLSFQGGMVMNLQIIGATLRSKEHEVKFINSLANGIVKSIEKL
jgi:hypothetical protein